MDSKRIRQVQEQTAHGTSVSVMQALMQVWQECELEFQKRELELLAQIKQLEQQSVLPTPTYPKEQFDQGQVPIIRYVPSLVPSTGTIPQPNPYTTTQCTQTVITDKGFKK
jgi:hypothetical protein